MPKFLPFDGKIRQTLDDANFSTATTSAMATSKEMLLHRNAKFLEGKGTINGVGLPLVLGTAAIAEVDDRLQLQGALEEIFDDLELEVMDSMAVMVQIF